MADLKITQLTANTDPQSTDLLAMVDDPAGSPVTKKVTIGDVLGSKTKVIYKSADETVNNSTTLQDDNALIIPVLANEVWAFKVILSINTNATADFKYKWSVPSGTTMDWFSYEFDNIKDQTSEIMLSGGIAAFSGGTIHGTIYTSSTAGNVVLQWAQNTLNVSDTKVLKGSHIIAWRLA